jgi:hypothetical protein
MNKPTPTEKFYLEKSKLDRILFIIGALCFITVCVLTITYSGFTTQPVAEIKVVLIPDEITLWIINSILGIVGGVLIDYRKFLASVPGGLITSLTITGFTLAYISFRETLISIEILLPLFVGAVIGALAYNFLVRLFYKKKQ